MPPALIFGSSAVACSFLVLWWAVSGERPASKAKTILTAGLAPVTDLRHALLSRSAPDRAVGPVLDRLAGWGRRLTPAGLGESLERRILLAGVPAAWPVERVLTTKVMLGGTGGLLGLFQFVASRGLGQLALAAGLASLGFFLPDLVLSSRGERRQKVIRQHLPDTLDQLTIAVEAGLGFEAAVARAARAGETPLAQELQRFLQDVQAGLTRRDALRGIVTRTDVPELRQFVAAVLQAEGYGIPIARTLRIQAGDLRVKRRQAAEERAMKLPVKVVFPLILCILPTIFIVVIGPAVIEVSTSLLGR